MAQSNHGTEFPRTYAQGASGTHRSPFVRRDSIDLRIQALRDEIATRQLALQECLVRREAIETECDNCPTARTEQIAARITGTDTGRTPSCAPATTLRPGEVDVDISSDLPEMVVS